MNSNHYKLHENVMCLLNYKLYTWEVEGNEGPPSASPRLLAGLSAFVRLDQEDLL